MEGILYILRLRLTIYTMFLHTCLHYMQKSRLAITVTMLQHCLEDFHCACALNKQMPIVKSISQSHFKTGVRCQTALPHSVRRLINARLSAVWDIQNVYGNNVQTFSY